MTQPIRGILIALGDPHEDLHVVLHPAGGVNIERRGRCRYDYAEKVVLPDADLLAVLRRAGVMVEDLIHRLADVEDAEPVAWSVEDVLQREG